jgi:hypothetical protein
MPAIFNHNSLPEYTGFEYIDRHRRDIDNTFGAPILDNSSWFEDASEKSHEEEKKQQQQDQEQNNMGSSSSTNTGFEEEEEETEEEEEFESENSSESQHQQQSDSSEEAIETSSWFTYPAQVCQQHGSFLAGGDVSNLDNASTFCGSDISRDSWSIVESNGIVGKDSFRSGFVIYSNNKYFFAVFVGKIPKRMQNKSLEQLVSALVRGRSTHTRHRTDNSDVGIFWIEMPSAINSWLHLLGEAREIDQILCEARVYISPDALHYANATTQIAQIVMRSVCGIKNAVFQSRGEMPFISLTSAQHSLLDRLRGSIIVVDDSKACLTFDHPLPNMMIRSSNQQPQQQQRSVNNADFAAVLRDKAHGEADFLHHIGFDQMSAEQILGFAQVCESAIETHVSLNKYRKLVYLHQRSPPPVYNAAARDSQIALSYYNQALCYLLDYIAYLISGSSNRNTSNNNNDQ